MKIGGKSGGPNDKETLLLLCPVITRSHLTSLCVISLDLLHVFKGTLLAKGVGGGVFAEKKKMSIYSKRLQSGVIALKGAGLKLLFYKY